ncbi:UNVERIFIED_CONTAM: hypothetical protein Sangu_1659900 [Sesamum angustifolium]|uniref:Reverse transcriptase zinc-binding domain-containing protein n=1 Tax=Sesamum angustifolium TaxID=2727405 RepID=A0AAW2MHW9_9LAMI
MAAQYLFRAGCRWRLGLGAQVQVWMNPWLTRPHSFHPITPPTTALAHTLVSDLIDPVRRHWKAELVQQLFWLCDGSVILAIPLNRMGEQDLLTWNYSKIGSFSVCSTYHLVVSLEDSPCSCSRAALESAWWRKVWQARIPNKVKVFVWRACQNALPTGANLCKRASISQVVCPLCGDDFEDVIHVLLCCPFARQVWGMVPLAANIKDCTKTGVLLWMQSVASHWFHNRCAMAGETVEPIQVVTFATQFLDSFLHQAAASSSLRDTGTYSTWQAPSLDFVKINFDGAVSGREGTMGVGVVARNS